MNNDRANSALLCGAQIFVVPTAIPKTRISGEQLRIPIWVVVHHKENFAVQVYALAGIGMMQFQIEENKDNVNRITTLGDLVARFGGGVDIYQTPNSVLGISASYVLDTHTRSFDPTADVYQYDFNYNYVSLSLGYTYRF